MSRLVRVVGALAILMAVADAIPAAGRNSRAGRWELLGDQTVTDRIDHDVVRVTRARGAFNALKLRVKGRAVQFRSMKVHFADGGSQEVELRSVIPAGGQSRVIRLEGGRRFIRNVEFWYDAQAIAGGRARVRLFGRH